MKRYETFHGKIVIELRRNISIDQNVTRFRSSNRSNCKDISKISHVRLFFDWQTASFNGFNVTNVLSEV